MIAPDAQLLWTQPDWLTQATAWIDAALERQGIRARGPIEQSHVRPWSTVLRVPTRDGDLYFKALPPALAHEVAITHALARWRPYCMPRVLAADTQRGWMLMTDAGTRLRSILQFAHDLRHWQRVLPLYAELQIELSNRVDQLLALGAPDRRLAAIPTRYEQLLDDADLMRVDRSPGLAAEEYERLRDLAPRLAATCAQLADYAIPASLNHGDLHDGNIFVHEGRYIFFDWGDASAAHPFFSLRTVMVSVENSLGLEAPAREQLRDLYLESWARYGSPANLRAAFTLAQQLWAISSALAWQTALTDAPASFREPYAEYVPALLRELLESQTAL